MRKILLLFIALFAISVSAYAVEPTKNVKIKIPVKPKDKDPSDERIPSPFMAPIDIFYYPASQSVEVVADDSLEGDVTLEHNGVVVDYSTSINTTFVLPYSTGTYTVTVTTENWTAYGELTL